MKTMTGCRSTSAVDGHNYVCASKAMTWKDRQRTRVPSFDLDDNPFCVERRTNEERHKMQFNKNPSLLSLTSADVRRTASFIVDDKKPFREFSRKKQQLLAWSLRDASTSGQKYPKVPAEKAIRRSKTVPSRLGDIGADIFLTTPESGRRGRNRLDVDVDTLPNLEPYRREVAALQPITFGHRPVSASRMFNPSTMMTSFGSSSCSATSCAQKGGRGRTGVSNKLRQFPLKRARREAKRVPPGRVPGLSAPMLKELLLRKKPRPRGGEARGGFPTPAAAYTCAGSPPGLRGEGERGDKRYAKGGGGLLGLNEGDGQLSDASTSNGGRSEWRSVDEAGGRPNAAWLKRSSLEGFLGGKGDSIEEGAELRRMFADARPKWDGTALLPPAPKDVRRAISSLLQPDPDERLRDKIAKSRKAAAGIPITPSSIMEEREKVPLPEMLSSRWEVPPVTPRTVIASEELKRLVEGRRQRDGAMTRRIREAELSAFYDKIPPSEKLYRDTLALARGKKRQEVA